MKLKTKLDFAKIDDAILDINIEYKGKVEIEVLKLRPKQAMRLVVIEHSFNYTNSTFTAHVGTNGILRLTYGNDTSIFRSIFTSDKVELCMLCEPDFSYYAFVTYFHKNQIKNTPVQYFASKEEADTLAEETASGMIESGIHVIAKHSELASKLVGDL